MIHYPFKPTPCIICGQKPIPLAEIKSAGDNFWFLSEQHLSERAYQIIPKYLGSFVCSNDLEKCLDSSRPKPEKPKRSKPTELF
jgi:hypothetical protein